MVLPPDLLLTEQGIADDFPSLKILPGQLHGGDLAVFVGFVIIDSQVGVAAGRIGGKLIQSAPNVNRTTLLGHTAENVKKLTDGFRFRMTGDGVHLCECGSDEPGGGAEIAGNPNGAHATAVRF